MFSSKKSVISTGIVLSKLIKYLNGISTTQVALVSISMDNDEMYDKIYKLNTTPFIAICNVSTNLKHSVCMTLLKKTREVVATEQEHAIDLEIALGIEKAFASPTKLLFE